MPNKIRNFAQTPEGILLIATGFDPVQRWDGLASSIVDAGLAAPASAITIAASGTGGILGTIVGYERYLDADGNPSSMSPVSSELSISSSSGSVTGATNASPIVVTSTAHGLTTGKQIKITGVIGNDAANGKWTVTVLTANTFSLNNSLGNGDYVAGTGAWAQGAGTITYSALGTAPSRAVTRQLYRSKDGNADVVYLDLEETNLTTTSFASTNDDDDLTESLALFDAENNDNALEKYDPPPAYKPFMAHLNGRMLATGDLVYGHGAIAVTNGSATVTGIDTDWTSSLVDRELWVVGSTAKYTITAVNTGTQALTLSAVFGGTTNPYARYAIRMPVGFRRSFEWSSVFAPEGWDATNEQEIPEDRLAGEITGMIAHSRWIYILAQGRIFRVAFQANPGDDGYVAPAPQRGLVNQRCWAIVEDYIRLIDRQGVYEFAGNDLQNVSDAIQEAFRPDGDGEWKINWRWSRYFHAVHDPEMEIVRFFVSLTGRYPRHCFCYNYRDKRWWIEEFPVGVPSSALGTLGDRRQVFVGAEARQILAINQGDTDGPDPTAGTLRGTATSAGLTWLADSGATFPPSAQLVNTALRIVAGKGKGQWRKIVSVSGAKLYVDMPWLSQPDTTSVYQLGGIEWRWRSGWMRWDDNDTQRERAIEVIARPVSRDSRLALRTYRDQDQSPYDWGFDRAQDDNNGIGVATDDPDLELDPTKANGFFRQQLDAGRDTESDGHRYVSVELAGVTNAERQQIYEVNVEGAAP